MILEIIVGLIVIGILLGLLWLLLRLIDRLTFKQLNKKYKPEDDISRKENRGSGITESSGSVINPTELKGRELFQDAVANITEQNSTGSRNFFNRIRSTKG